MSEIQLVLAQCSHCKTSTTKPKGYTGLVFCSQNCQDGFNDSKTAAFLDSEAAKFLAKHEDFYPCPYNHKLIGDRLAKWKQIASLENLDSAYMHLLMEGKLLGKLTMADVNKMTSPEYDAREAIDPQLGGAMEAAEAAGKAKFAAPVSYKSGGTGGWEAMHRANLAQRQKQADDRAASRRR
jgi:hypothetical protein